MICLVSWLKLATFKLKKENKSLLFSLQRNSIQQDATRLLPLVLHAVIVKQLSMDYLCCPCKVNCIRISIMFACLPIAGPKVSLNTSHHPYEHANLARILSFRRVEFTWPSKIVPNCALSVVFGLQCNEITCSKFS